MSFERLAKDMNIIAQLDDEPNDVGGLTSAELKAKFDEGGLAVKDFINNVLIPALEGYGVENAVQHRTGNIRYIRLTDDFTIEASADGELWIPVGGGGGGGIAMKLVKGSFPNWVPTDHPQITQPASAAYGNGRFVVLTGYGYGAGLVSADGVHWEKFYVPGATAESNLSAVAFGNGHFICFDAHQGHSFVSEDGITWIDNYYSGAWGAYESIVYGNGMFIATSEQNVSNNTKRLVDGSVNWELVTLPEGFEETSGAAFGGGKFIILPANLYESQPVSYKAAISEDGVNWDTVDMPSLEGNGNIAWRWRLITYGNGRFVAIAHAENSTYAHFAAYSDDGETWTVTELPSFRFYDALCFGGGRFIAFGRASDKVAVSYDGITWTEGASRFPEGGFWIGGAYGGGKFVAFTSEFIGKLAYFQDSKILQNGVDVTADMKALMNGTMR